MRELQRARERRGLTQQQLADRLEQLGSPIDRSTIGKIEARRRGISVDEVFAFAAALSVSPLSLTVPRSGTRMRVAPTLEADTLEVLLWARNVRYLHTLPADRSDNDSVMAAIRDFLEAMTDREAEAYRAHPRLRGLVHDAAHLVACAADTDQQWRFKDFLVPVAEAAQRLWEDIGEEGLAAPASGPGQSLVEINDNITQYSQRLLAAMEALERQVAEREALGSRPTKERS